MAGREANLPRAALGGGARSAPRAARGPATQSARDGRARLSRALSCDRSRHATADRRDARNPRRKIRRDVAATAARQRDHRRTAQTDAATGYQSAQIGARTIGAESERIFLNALVTGW